METLGFLADWSLQELRKRWGAETMRASSWQHFYRTYTQRKHRSRFFGCDLAPSWDSETDITIATLGTSSRKACTQPGTGPGFKPSQPEAWSTLQGASLLKVVLLRCSSQASRQTRRLREEDPNLRGQNRVSTQSCKINEEVYLTICTINYI